MTSTHKRLFIAVSSVAESNRASGFAQVREGDSYSDGKTATPLRTDVELEARRAAAKAVFLGL